MSGPGQQDRPRFAIAAAVNDRDVLDRCLRASPDVREGGIPVAVYEGYKSAGAAYNAALDEAAGEILILAHQDVYLPRNFIALLGAKLAELDALDPDWAVVGLMGSMDDGQRVGSSWSSGLAGVMFAPGTLPARVQSLDEMLIVVKVAAGLRFDPALPSFHLYGTDIVQSARKAGRSAYVVDAPVIHHSRPLVELGGGYRSAYRYMQHKWRANLPIANPVCKIQRSILPLLYLDWKIRFRKRGQKRTGNPTEDPSEIARRVGYE